MSQATPQGGGDQSTDMESVDPTIAVHWHHNEVVYEFDYFPCVETLRHPVYCQHTTILLRQSCLFCLMEGPCKGSEMLHFMWYAQCLWRWFYFRGIADAGNILLLSLCKKYKLSCSFPAKPLQPVGFDLEQLTIMLFGLFLHWKCFEQHIPVQWWEQALNTFATWDV